MDAGFINTAQTFFRNLAANNEKPWWEENRTTYDNVLKPGAKKLLEDVQPRLAELMDEEVTTKLFRPYRDTRFSKDKTPYKPYMHMLWQVNVGREPVAFFFGIEPDYIRCGGGMLGMGKEVLEDWRKFCDLDAKRMMGAAERIEAEGYEFREPELVRIPRGYPKDHENARMLRMKSVIATKKIEPTDDIADLLMAEFETFKPITDALLSVACA